jgi:hypothetical protein
MTYICHGPTIPLTDEQIKAITDDPDNPMNWCCYGAAANGPSGCTCWKPEYSQRRRKPIPPAEMKVRAKQCEDCAYRHDSAEWNDDYDRDHLENLANGAGLFVCHQGIAYIVRWRHPEGMVIEQPLDDVGHVAAYKPLYIGEVPFKASGRPADLCAGYAARTRVTVS